MEVWRYGVLLQLVASGSSPRSLSHADKTSQRAPEHIKCFLPFSFNAPDFFLWSSLLVKRKLYLLYLIGTLIKPEAINSMASLMLTSFQSPRAVYAPRLYVYLITPKRLSSSKRWQSRQLKDRFTREATVQGLKSRAAFKLLQVYLLTASCISPWHWPR